MSVVAQHVRTLNGKPMALADMPVVPVVVVRAALKEQWSVGSSKSFEFPVGADVVRLYAVFFVIAVGACAISGGPFIDHDAQSNGCGNIVPVDMYIPGCPPHLVTILDGILRWLGRIEGNSR